MLILQHKSLFIETVILKTYSQVSVSGNLEIKFRKGFPLCSSTNV
jgi:hypothetical protein